MINTLRNVPATAAHSHTPLRAAGQGVARHLRPDGQALQNLSNSHLNIGSADLPDLLDLAPALPDQAAALRGRHDQLQGEALLPLLPPSALLVLDLVADEGVGLDSGLYPLPFSSQPHLEYRLSGARHSDHPLRTGPVTDVDLGPALLADVVDDLSALPDDGPHLLPRHEAPEGQVDARHVARELELCLGHPDSVEVWRMMIRLGSGIRLD